jgi:hypothetical protein
VPKGGGRRHCTRRHQRRKINYFLCRLLSTNTKNIFFISAVIMNNTKDVIVPPSPRGRPAAPPSRVDQPRGGATSPLPPPLHQHEHAQECQWLCRLSTKSAPSQGSLSSPQKLLNGEGLLGTEFDGEGLLGTELDREGAVDVACLGAALVLLGRSCGKRG